MAASKCLVAYGDKNVVVTFHGPWTKENLTEHIKTSKPFEGLDFSAMSLKVFDKDFEMYVDIDDDFIIPDKARLLIKETVQYRIVDVLNVEEAVPSAVCGDERTVYLLPNMPLDVKLSIDRHQQGHYFENRRRVLQWLYNDLCSYRMYPGKLYEEAARALIAMFPNLADSTGTGYDSWREGLRFKGKYERYKLRKANEGETGAPPPKISRSSPQNKLPLRITRPSAALNLNDAEDEDSIAAHIAGMQKEMLKASPNYEYIMDSISRTYSERRLWISKEIPSVADVVEKYPALTTSTIAHLEFHLLTKVQLVDALQHSFSAAAAKIVDAARKKRHLDGFMKELVDRADYALEAPKNNDVLLTAAVCVLPSLVKERMEAFICPEDPEATYLFPKITYRGSSIFDATLFTVRLEDISIIEENLLAAVATQIALYWVFDIVFDSKAKKSLDLFCRAAQVDSGVSPTPLTRLAVALFAQ